MFGVAAAAGAGWLFLFLVLLAVPPRRDGAGAAGGDEPPAVVALLDRRLGRCGFGATLVDLAARGWFQLRGRDKADGPVLCVVAAEPPDERLEPYERRVLAHVAVRTGAGRQAPAPALSDGFEGGEAAFMKAFREEVEADARQRGLTRARLSPGRIAVLCLLLPGPAGALLLAIGPAHRNGALGFGGLCTFFAFGLIIKGGTSRGCSAAGRAARRRRRAVVTAADGGDERRLGYAAALGAAPDAVAVFAPAGKDAVWSSYRGSWQQLPIEKNTWPWPRTIVVLVAVIAGPILYFAGVFWLFTQGLAGVAIRVIGVTAVAAVSFVVWGASRRARPRFAEFDGQVLRQRFVKGGDDSPDEYHVVIDDGGRATAWDLDVGSEPYRRLTPGTFVHVRLNLRGRDQVTVMPVEPPAVARPLAGVAAEQQRAAAGGVPDPADLVTAHEAAVILGGPARGEHADNSMWQTMIWQPAGRTQPVLRIVVRQAVPQSGRGPMPRGARPVPGVADGYLDGTSGWLHVSMLTAIITVPAGTQASLTWLLPLVEARLRDFVMRSGT